MKKSFCVYSFIFLSVISLGQTAVVTSTPHGSVEEYKLEPLNKLNTLKSEFAAVPYGKGIVFVSEQKKDLVNFESIDVDGHPYLDIFFSEDKNGTYSSKKSFSKKNNSEFHDGPMTFSPDYKTAYLTRSTYVYKKNKSFVNQSKLFTIAKKGNGWGKPKPFVYDSDEYSLGHASVSSDGKWLFFSSDMKGGFGGTDLYMCEWTDNNWGKPVNLGDKVNTPGNELFPFIRKDGTLFFSSNNHQGFGGLDIYSAGNIEGKWALNRNEGLNINSPGDDFAICFSDSVNGYVSSNRNGSDDLFKFVFTQKHIDFEGFVLNSKDVFDSSPNMMLELTDSAGNVLKRTRTDENGYFKFHNLNTDSTYLVRIDEQDGSFTGKRHYYFADKRHNLLRVTGHSGNEDFVFKNLPIDNTAVPELDLDDDKIIAGNLFVGQEPIKNARVVLKDKNGNIVDEATTNSFGAFVFNHIPPDEALFIELVEADGALPPGSKITVTNRSGKTIETTVTDKSGKFVMRFLEKDSNDLKEMSVEDSEVRIDFRAIITDENNNPIPNLIVFLKDDKQKTIESDTTDTEGKFNFKKLLTDKNYLVELDENDPRLTNFQKVTIKTLKGKLIKEIVRNKEGFTFHILKGDQSELNDLYIDDPWLSVLNFKNSTEKKEIDIEEKVYYTYGTYAVDEAGKKILNKVVQIMKDNPNITIELISHTDSQSSSEFNKKLSERRAKAAVDYVVKRGIKKDRLVAIGYGESKIKNKCVDGVVCTEAEHAENRRTEFRVVSEQK